MILEAARQNNKQALSSTYFCVFTNFFKNLMYLRHVRISDIDGNLYKIVFRQTPTDRLNTFEFSWLYKAHFNTTTFFPSNVPLLTKFNLVCLGLEFLLMYVSSEMVANIFSLCQQTYFVFSSS